MLAAFVGQIWLLVLIFRGSPMAALLCVIVPFLGFFFIRDHWISPRRPSSFGAAARVVYC